ncbi:MAG: DPP IV N-terminal domain-containing protein [Planctomyces sp.]
MHVFRFLNALISSVILIQYLAWLALWSTVSAVACPTATAEDGKQQPSIRSQNTAAKQKITWDHVYGTKRFELVENQDREYIWLSDTAFLTSEDGLWKRHDVVTGSSEAWYDADALARSLQKVPGIEAEEAQRLASGSWDLISHQHRVVVFVRGSSLVRTTLDGTSLTVVEGLPSTRELMELNPTATAVAFISQNELWAADFETSRIVKLTEGASDRIRNGKADWVYYEELLGRNWKAYQWSPDGKKLAFLQCDDSSVPQYELVNQARNPNVKETEFYPEPGDPNPQVQLGVIDLIGSPVVCLSTPDPAASERIISGFQWSPDSRFVLWYSQNRTQTFLDVVESDAISGASRPLLRDQTEAWIESPGQVRFLTNGDFLIFSERTGRRHLYRAARSGRDHGDGRNAAAELREDVRLVPVTSGDWDVRTLAGVSADETFLLVTGTLDSTVADQIYRVPLSHVVLNRNGAQQDDSPQDNAPQRLSPDDGHHVADVSPGGKHLIDRWSRIDQPPTMGLRDASGRMIRTLQHPASVPRDQWQLAQLELRKLPLADGTQGTALFAFPPGFDPGRKYPVWLMTYGGPRFQTVRNAWNNRMQEHLLAGQDIVVIRFDTRSAGGHGSRDVWKVHRQLGVEETRDVEAVCQWLKGQSWVHSERIGLSGYSYGGYLTVYAMTHCDHLCAGIAGAPVTDWKAYDSIYTERYMSTPEENPDGYRRSSALRNAGDLHGRLLLVHGLLDDNVHPENSLRLVHELQKAGRPFDLMLYPEARHGIAGAHYEKLVYNFIVEAMGRSEARRP